MTALLGAAAAVPASEAVAALSNQAGQLRAA